MVANVDKKAESRPSFYNGTVSETTEAIGDFHEDPLLPYGHQSLPNGQSTSSISEIGRSTQEYRRVPKRKKRPSLSRRSLSYPYLRSVSIDEEEDDSTESGSVTNDCDDDENEGEDGHDFQYRIMHWTHTAILLFGEYICLAIMVKNLCFTDGEFK